MNKINQGQRPVRGSTRQLETVLAHSVLRGPRNILVYLEELMAGTQASSPVRGLTWLTYMSSLRKGGWPRKAKSQRVHPTQILEGPSPPGRRCHPLLPLPTLQKKLQDQRQCIVAEFEQGHQFLREREQHLLGQLAKLEQELTEGPLRQPLQQLSQFLLIHS